MAKVGGSIATQLFERVGGFMKKCLFRILSVGPVPVHIAFIMDGNRRYSKKRNLEEGAGHEAGYLALMSMLHYCYELGVKYVTIYAFSIENFKRRPEEVLTLMDLMLEKITELIKKESIVNHYGIRVYFIGNLKLLSEPVRTAAEKVMKSSANNTKAVLLICVAYTSTNEIVHAVQESCRSNMEESEKMNGSIQESCKDNLNKSQGLNGICNGVIEQVEESEKTNSSVKKSCKDNLNKSQRLNGARKGVIEGVEGITKRSGMTADAVQGSCGDRWNQARALRVSRTSNGATEKAGANKMFGEHSVVKLVDINRQMYMAVAPDPDTLPNQKFW